MDRAPELVHLCRWSLSASVPRDVTQGFQPMSCAMWSLSVPAGHTAFQGLSVCTCGQSSAAIAPREGAGH